MNLSIDTLIMNYESADIHTLYTLPEWALSIDFIIFPSMLQILMNLSFDPLMMYLESADIHTLFTLESWALSIDLISFP